MNDLWVLELVDGAASWTRIFAAVAGGGEILPRSGASLTAAGDLVYLFGGQDPMTGGTFNDVLVLDTVKWEWSDLEVKGGKPPPRHSHCTGLLQDNSLLVFGGAALQGTLGDVWIFNIGQRTWTRPNVGGYAPPAREMHAGVMVAPTRLLIFGGRGMDGRILCDAAVLDAGTMSWVTQDATPFARCAHAAAVVPLPGATPAAPGASSSSGSPPAQVLVHGGFSGDAVVGDVLLLDPATLRMTLLQPTPSTPSEGPAARFAHCAATLQTPDRKQVMVVFGGVNPQEDLSDVAMWVPAPTAPSQPSSADTTMHAAAPAAGDPTTSGHDSVSAAEGPAPSGSNAAAAGAGVSEESCMQIDGVGEEAFKGTAETAAGGSAAAASSLDPGVAAAGQQLSAGGQ